ncbi:hypothetical protein [Haloferax volcanii pleomorphic virus 1]|nr:hypothetical protein [Haloferax volcanii pleomorphic virus 1]
MAKEPPYSFVVRTWERLWFPRANDERSMSEVDLDAIEDAMLRHRDPVVTTGDLADELGCSSRHVLNQLRILERTDDVGSKQVGARAVAWWHVDRVTPPTMRPDEHPDQTALDDASETSDDRDGFEDLLADWTPGRTDAKRQEQRDAGRAALRVLRDDGRMTRSDFEDELLPAFAVEDQSKETWWRKSVRPALRLAVDDGRAVHHHGPPHEYEWV